VARIRSKRTDFQIIAAALAPDFKCELADAKAHVVVLDSLEVITEDTIFAPNDRDRRLVKFVLVTMGNDQQQFATAIRLGVLVTFFTKHRR
jgi:hypothetical protein